MFRRVLCVVALDFQSSALCSFCVSALDPLVLTLFPSICLCCCQAFKIAISVDANHAESFNNLGVRTLTRCFPTSKRSVFVEFGGGSKRGSSRVLSRVCVVLSVCFSVFQSRFWSCARATSRPRAPASNPVGAHTASDGSAWTQASAALPALLSVVELRAPVPSCCGALLRDNAAHAHPCLRRLTRAVVCVRSAKACSAHVRAVLQRRTGRVQARGLPGPCPSQPFVHCLASFRPCCACCERLGTFAGVADRAARCVALRVPTCAVAITGELRPRAESA